MNERILQLEQAVDELYSIIEKLEEKINALKVENHTHVHYEFKGLTVNNQEE